MVSCCEMPLQSGDLSSTLAPLSLSASRQEAQAWTAGPQSGVGWGGVKGEAAPGQGLVPPSSCQAPAVS